MKLSVIISAYNNHPLTVVHVRECANSIHIPNEIIVVNDAGTPDLRDKLLKLKKESKIVSRLIYARINEEIAWNYTGARNLGFWLSTGDYISIEDNDHIPHKDFYKEAVEKLETNPNVGKVKTYKRWVVNIEDVLSKPIDEWKVISSRVPHQDVAIIRRDVYLKVKGYDERFAGAYGWSATDWKRRLLRAEVITANAGYQYVVSSEKTSGLSYRNYQFAREQREIQSPKGILNFTYNYEIL